MQVSPTRSHQSLHFDDDVSSTSFQGTTLIQPETRGVHCDNIRKQRAGKYRVIYIHKRKNLEFS
jgi:hypothetical protein